MERKQHMIKLLVLSLLLYSSTLFASDVYTYRNENHPPVKESRYHICHAKGTEFYASVTHFKEFNTIQECIASGARLPKPNPYKHKTRRVE